MLGVSSLSELPFSSLSGLSSGWNVVTYNADTWTEITAGTETWTDITPGSDTWIQQG